MVLRHHQYSFCKPGVDHHIRAIPGISINSPDSSSGGASASGRGRSQVGNSAAPYQRR